MPSLMHRVLTTETWVKRFIKFAPIAEIKQELVRFETNLLLPSPTSPEPTVSRAHFLNNALGISNLSGFICQLSKETEAPRQEARGRTKIEVGRRQVVNYQLSTVPYHF